MSDCQKCLWCDQCHTECNCPNYTPIEEDVDSIIENGRSEYREAFFSYEREVNNNF